MERPENFTKLPNARPLERSLQLARAVKDHVDPPFLTLSKRRQFLVDFFEGDVVQRDMIGSRRILRPLVSLAGLAILA